MISHKLFVAVSSNINESLFTMQEKEIRILPFDHVPLDLNIVLFTHKEILHESRLIFEFYLKLFHENPKFPYLRCTLFTNYLAILTAHDTVQQVTTFIDFTLKEWKTKLCNNEFKLLIVFFGKRGDIKWLWMVWGDIQPFWAPLFPSNTYVKSLKWNDCPENRFYISQTMIIMSLKMDIWLMVFTY